MNKEWPHLTPDLAAVIIHMYTHVPPRNAKERRHLKAAQAASPEIRKMKNRIRGLRAYATRRENNGDGCDARAIRDMADLELASLTMHAVLPNPTN